MTNADRQLKLPLQNPTAEEMADPLMGLIYGVLRSNNTRCLDDVEDRLVVAQALVAKLRGSFGGG